MSAIEPVRRGARHRVSSVAWIVFMAAMVLFMCAPLLGVLGTSFNGSTSWAFPPSDVTTAWYRDFFDNDGLVDALIASLIVGVAVSLLGTAVGLLASVALSRSERRERSRLGGLALLPLLFPTIGLGLAMLTFLVEAGLGLNVRTLVIAQLVLVLPFTIRLLDTGLRGVNPSAERAAMNLGASKARTLGTVTIPAMRSSIIAAAVLALMLSLDDAAIALFVNSGRFVTLPVKLLFLRDTDPGPLIAAGGSILLLLGVLMLIVVDRTLGLRRAFGLKDEK